MTWKRAALITLLLLALPFVGVGLWLRAERRHYALNRALIAALVQGDDERALALVNKGADPNTRYTPPPAPSLKQLCNQILHHKSPPINRSSTALSIACGADWTDEGETGGIQVDALALRDPVRLVLAMLRHGANVNAQEANEWAPLMWAIRDNRRNTVRVLLENGANVNVQAGNGWTPLMEAAAFHASSEIVHLLLKHGANVNAQDSSGDTALYYVELDEDNATKDAIRQLIAYGADPNLPNKQGDTALKLAQEGTDRELVALLRHSGARK